MAEVTYVAEVECVVVIPDGILDTQVVKVIDVDNKKHTLRVAKGALVVKGSKTYLPVSLIHVDRKTGRALVELPQEADSGTSRIWVPFAQFRRQESDR
jgi:hypothetical protein